MPLAFIDDQFWSKHNEKQILLEYYKDKDKLEFWME